MKTAVFLDRDDTIIHNSGDLGDPGEVRLIQGVASAIASLKGLNYLVVVVSNQGGVARGKYSTADVNKVNERINDLVKSMTGAKIDRFYYCPFHPKGTVEKYTKEHPWRKPQPGMLLQAAKDLDIDLEKSWMIGDSLRDVAAGQAAGTRTVFLAGEDAPADGSLENARGAADVEGEVTPDFIAQTLVEAVRIVAQKRSALDHGQLDTTDHVKHDDFKPAAKTGQPNESEKSVDDAKQKVGKLISATESKPATEESKTEDKSEPAKREAKPFKPWNVGPDKPPAPAVTHKPKPQPAAEEDKSIVEPVKPMPTSKSFKPATARPAESVKPAPPQPEPLESEEPLTESTGETPGESNIPMEVTLRQILQELRSRRRVVDDFSYLKMFAVVLQMVAAACLLAALVFSGDDFNSFIRYIGTGLLIQLAVIAMLLFQKK